MACNYFGGFWGASYLVRQVKKTSTSLLYQAVRYCQIPRKRRTSAQSPTPNNNDQQKPRQANNSANFLPPNKIIYPWDTTGLAPNFSARLLTVHAVHAYPPHSLTFRIAACAPTLGLRPYLRLHAFFSSNLQKQHRTLNRRIKHRRWTISTTHYEVLLVGWGIQSKSHIRRDIVGANPVWRTGPTS